MSRPWSSHGYTAYSHGCRCETCREAKRTYMASKRAAARSDAPRDLINARGRYVAPIDTHGTLSGWQEHSCRCLDCSAAKSRAHRRQYYARATQAPLPSRPTGSG